jgi:aminomethyltransferase
MSVTSPERTSLYHSHLESNAKIVDFHGFELPIWYSSIQEEHLATRSSAGLFDVSHMGFFRFTGHNVSSWLSSLATQEFSKFKPGSCGYTHFLDDNGYIIDDMIFAVVSESEILGVPNASMISTMMSWFSKHLPLDKSITIEDNSRKTSIIALQGPASEAILSSVLGPDNVVKKFKCQKIRKNDLKITGWIQGTGYTGEPGVEIFVPNESAPLLWKKILGCKGSGVVPVGLGARDTLRLEKGYLLSGQDFLWPGLGINPDFDLPINFLSRNTAETNVPFGLDLNHDFIGKDFTKQSIMSNKKWVGLVCQDRGPSPRPGHAVFLTEDTDDIVGYVTSGGPSPSLNRKGIAMAYVDSVRMKQEVWIQVSTRKRIKAVISITPFV